MADITYVRRIEPRASAQNFVESYAAEIHDPLWFLARQWHVGEFRGEDTGSVAFVEFGQSTAKMTGWRAPGASAFFALDQGAPLERQALNEPFEPDLGSAVELGHDFADILHERVGNAGEAQAILELFLDVPAFQVNELEDESLVDPVDPATKRFLMVCAGRVVNGVALFNLGVAIEGGGSVPPEVTTDAQRIAHIEAALGVFVERTRSVFGDVGNVDPVTWQPRRLEYGVEVAGINPDTSSGAALGYSLKAYPDSDGEFDWFSFDADDVLAATSGSAPVPTVHATTPARVQFDGMPSTRFWNFEDNHLPIPHIAAETDEVVKLLVTNFMMLHSHDWYVFPAEQEVAALTRTRYVVVHDVFGRETVVRRADAEQPLAGLDRWTMFSTSDDSGTMPRVADYFIMPPSAGPAMQLGAVLEDVRFGRDEMANMAWGIEHITTSPIGEQRRGTERSAQIDEAIPPSEPPAIQSNFPLRYEIESRVPYNWIPLLPVQPNAGNPSIVLRRGGVLQDLGEGDPVPVPSLSSILNPPLGGAPYDIEEEEIARSGLRVQRVVYRTRWFDGSTHLWVQRRRKIGAGESQSGLRFDQARANQT
jgi:hypothetical protein